MPAVILDFLYGLFVIMLIAINLYSVRIVPPDQRIFLWIVILFAAGLLVYFCAQILHDGKRRQAIARIKEGVPYENK